MEDVATDSIWRFEHEGSGMALGGINPMQRLTMANQPSTSGTTKKRVNCLSSAGGVSTWQRQNNLSSFKRTLVNLG